jgi:hypothetical protein
LELGTEATGKPEFEHRRHKDKAERRVSHRVVMLGMHLLCTHVVTTFGTGKLLIKQMGYR